MFAMITSFPHIAMPWSCLQVFASVSQCGRLSCHTTDIWFHRGNWVLVAANLSLQLWYSVASTFLLTCTGGLHNSVLSWVTWLWNSVDWAVTFSSIFVIRSYFRDSVACSTVCWPSAIMFTLSVGLTLVLASEASPLAPTCCFLAVHLAFFLSG